MSEKIRSIDIRRGFMTVVLGGLGGLLWTQIAPEALTHGLKETISYEYERKLEDYKRKLELQFEAEVRRRKLYEELTLKLENLYGTIPQSSPKEAEVTINKIFALLALYASDEVYRSARNTFYSRQGKEVRAGDITGADIFAPYQPQHRIE